MMAKIANITQPSFNKTILSVKFMLSLEIINIISYQYKVFRNDEK